jgi:hypothetical protein
LRTGTVVAYRYRSYKPKEKWPFFQNQRSKLAADYVKGWIALGYTYRTLQVLT